MDEHLIRFVQTVVVPQYWEVPNGRGARHLNDVLASARRRAVARLRAWRKLG